MHGGIAFARHTDYADMFVDWHGHVRAYDGSAMWSPHGRYVALPYTQCANGSCESWSVVTRANGSHRRVLEYAGAGISWAADESRLAYIDSFGSLEVANGDGSGVHRVAVDTPASALLFDPKVSPDGRSVALVVVIAPTQVASNVPGRLYVVPSTGGAAVPVGNDDICPDGSDVEWSPDGAWLAYLGNECIGHASNLEVLSPDGATHGVKARVAHGYAWSPAGAMLAYEDGNGVVVAGPRATLSTTPGAHSPSWSPHDHRLVVERRGRIEILDNGTTHVIAHGTSPTWTTHGIAWSVPRCGPEQGIWLAGRRLTDVCEVDGTHGTQWPDEVWAVDHKRERVTCGAAHDIAHVDRSDVVATDCEVVRRPRRP